MPLTWPLGHIGTAVSKPEEDQDVPKPSATPYLTLVRQALDIFFLDKLSVKKKGRPPYFHGRSNTILGTCLPLHLPFAATVRTGWKSNSTITSDILLQVYPAFGPGKDFTMDWMLLIVARNLIATWVICGFWDWFLYFSPLQVNCPSVHICIHVHHLPHDILSQNDFLFVFCVWSK